MWRVVRWLVLFGCAGAYTACVAQVSTGTDTDADGLSDSLESRLSEQFRPVWMVSVSDCSSLPARFVPELSVPQVIRDDGTIYVGVHRRDDGNVEVHYYHLWRRDCGEMGHALDTEHVAVLLHEHEDAWRAEAWYAAAHEDTLCDASQVTRASTIDAEHHGAMVWVSAGKHASYFAERLCRFGCGGDHCDKMKRMPDAELINLGEPERPAVAWTHAPQWPLLRKMERTDFTTARMQRLAGLPETDIAWATPEKRPAQAAILGANAGVGGASLGASTGARATGTAMVIAKDRTDDALGKAARNTGDALKRSFHNVRRALGAKQDDTSAPAPK